MEIHSIRSRSICVPLSIPIGGIDELPKWIRDKLIALGISVSQNITEEQALFLIEQKEKEIKEKKKIEKTQKNNPESYLYDEQKLLKSLDVISQNNKIAIEINKKKNPKIN